MSEDGMNHGEEQAKPRWVALSRIDRRVAGVLVEKAKTTPSAYPMTLNAITNGCNQKSNRFPTMQLEPDEVEESLDRLRQLGAIGVIEGYGRVDKYRHYLYEWLGVEKVELSVMAELLLRGPQTVGELRGRASRMDAIADLATLQTILDDLKAKELVLGLTPSGRGHVVCHGLFQPNELEKIRAEYQGAGGSVDAGAERSDAATAVSAAPARVPSRELEELRDQIAQLRSDLDDLTGEFQQAKEELRRLREDLGA